MKKRKPTKKKKPENLPKKMNENPGRNLNKGKEEKNIKIRNKIQDSPSHRNEPNEIQGKKRPICETEKEKKDSL